MSRVKQKTDPFLLFLVAVVVVILAVFLIKSFVLATVDQRVEGARTGEGDSPASMMRDLQKTVDDAGMGDFKQLDRAAGGL